MNAPAPPRIANASRHSGFTLLEVLFALLLMAIAMAAVWGALHTGATLARSADASIQRSDRVRAVQQFLREYLGGAQPQAYASGGDKSARMFDGGPRQLTWVAPMPAQLGDGGLFVQTMQLLPDKDGHGYTLQLNYAPLASDTQAPANATPELLLDHVADGEFEYLVTDHSGGPARWRSSWRSPAGLPLAVRIAIKPGWNERIAFPEMLIPLRAGNGQGYGQPDDPGETFQ